MDYPKLEVNEVQLGKWRVNRSTKYSLVVEFSRRKEDNTLSGISITVRFPDDSSASQHLRAIMPVTSTLVVLGILMVWSAFAIHKSFFILSLILGIIAFRAHLQASPFAPYRGELCIHLDAKNICGFRYLNRLTETGMVTLESKEVRLSWTANVSDTIEIPNSPSSSSKIKEKEEEEEKDRKITSMSLVRAGVVIRRKLNEITCSSKVISLPDVNILSHVLKFCRTIKKRSRSRSSNSSSFSETKQSLINLFCPRGDVSDDLTHRDTIMKNQMISFKFSEPLLPLLLKRFVLENEELIPHCESGMPGWSIFLASYGFFYRREMRHIFTIAVWLASLCMMLVGIFDLFRTFPVVRSLYILAPFLKNHRHRHTQVRRAFAWMLGNWFAWFEEAIVLRALSVLTFLLPSAALNFLKVFQMMWRAGTNLVFMLLDLLSAPLMLLQTLFRAISAIVRPVFMCCSKLSSLRSAASVAAPAAQAASQGQSFMSILWREVLPFLKFLWTLFRNIILNGITKIGMWVLQHWTSFHRFVIVRHFRVIVFTGSILSLLMAWSLWLDD